MARDIGSGDPERMAAPRAAAYIIQAFKGRNYTPKVTFPQAFSQHCRTLGSDVTVEVISDRNVLEKEYPLVASVARASWRVER